MPARLLAAAAVALAVSAVALPGAAGAAPATIPSRLLWATINVCDTDAHPDTIGIRASMPGVGRDRDRMYMRFQVQYFQVSANQWVTSDATADSGFQYVGRARFRRRESGWNFAITPPPSGQSYRLRGVVTFEWRRAGEVLRRARRVTRAGHRGTFGSDPKGYSAAECTIASS